MSAVRLFKSSLNWRALFGAAIVFCIAGAGAYAQTKGRDGKPSAPVNIPFTGTFGLPNSNAAASDPVTLPSGEAFPRPAKGFLPSPATQPHGEENFPTLPDFKADYTFSEYQRGFYKAAFQGATIRAARNPHDGAARTLLAELYAQGLGVTRDMAKAEELYQQAANQNDANAMFALAMIKLSQSSTGAESEKASKHAEAISWLEKAAAANHPLANYNLAVALLGSRRNVDLVRAVDLLRKAAEQEVPDAQYALAVLLREGQGVLQNSIEAGQWMSRAATNGSLTAQVELAIMLFNGNGMAANEVRAARLFALAAGRGNAIAQNRLARILAAGRGMPKDLVEAAAWHMMASKQGRSDPWLDTELKILTPEERKRAEDIARTRTEDLNFGLEP